MPDLESLLREHYARSRLPEDRASRILTGAPARTAPRRVQPNRVWHLRIAAVAAALVAGFGLLHFHIVERDAEIRVLAEIAMNHKKQLAVEVSAGSFSAVERALDRLDIPIRPSGDRLAGYDLLGGRYCSIQGGLAAQLRLRDRETGRPHTLYATALTPALTGLEDAAVHDGIVIALWREGAVFFALAGDRPQGERQP